MPASVKKWGHSAAVRIPAGVLAAAEMALDQQVIVRAEDGRIIIEPVPTEETLDDLLAGITPENRHDAVETGEPVGREDW